MLPRVGRDILVVHVADTDGLLRRRTEAAKLQVVGHAMLAEVFGWDGLSPGIEGTYLETCFAEGLDDHTTAGPGADHHYVIGLHRETPPATGQHALDCRR